MSGTSPPPPDPPPPRPIDLPMTPLAVGGTVLWLLAAAIMVPFQDSLSDSGRGWWLSCALTGAGLGVIGIVVMVLHDRGRRHRE